MDSETRMVRPPPKRGEGTANPPRIIDPATGFCLPTPGQRTRLKTLEHVKLELGRVYRAVKGHLASDEGSKRAYILVQLGKIIEVADLERRLEALERQQQLLPGPDAETAGD